MVDAYGWHSSTPTYSQSYINPALLRILRAEQPARLLDLGCGNGSLCRFLHSHGFAAYHFFAGNSFLSCLAKMANPIAFPRNSCKLFWSVWS